MDEPTREELGRAAVILAKAVERLERENAALSMENARLQEEVSLWKSRRVAAGDMSHG